MMLEKLDAVRELLARFPLSIIQLAGRIGVGVTFLKAGLLKYNSWEFTVKLFEDEYRVPLLDPAVAARIAMIQELTISILLFLGLATRSATVPLLGMITGHSDLRVPKCVQRPSRVGIDPGLDTDARSGYVSVDYLIERPATKRSARAHTFATTPD